MRRIAGTLLYVLGGLTALSVLWICSTAIYKGRSLLGSTKTVSGKVVEVSEAGAFDAVFHLEGYKGTFYINRGLQYYDFTLDGLRQLSKGRTVQISYVSSRTPFDLEGQSGHINKLVVGDSVVFDEVEGIPAYK